MPETQATYIPETEDSRVAVAQKMLRELDERVEFWLDQVNLFRQATGTVGDNITSTLNAYEAEATTLRWLMQRAGVPLEPQTPLDGG